MIAGRGRGADDRGARRRRPGSRGARGHGLRAGVGHDRRAPALAAAAYALACYAPFRAAAAAALVAGCGQALFLAVERLTLGQTWAAAAAAVAIGAISHGIAGRVRVPPLVLIVPAIVPLLPGPDDLPRPGPAGRGQEDGVLELAAAGATAIALAAGVILGQYLVQPLRRGSRITGPRLAR